VTHIFKIHGHDVRQGNVAIRYCPPFGLSDIIICPPFGHRNHITECHQPKKEANRIKTHKTDMKQSMKIMFRRRRTTMFQKKCTGTRKCCLSPSFVVIQVVVEVVVALLLSATTASSAFTSEREKSFAEDKLLSAAAAAARQRHDIRRASRRLSDVYREATKSAARGKRNVPREGAAATRVPARRRRRAHAGEELIIQRKRDEDIKWKTVMAWNILVPMTSNPPSEDRSRTAREIRRRRSERRVIKGTKLDRKERGRNSAARSLYSLYADDSGSSRNASASRRGRRTHRLYAKTKRGTTMRIRFDPKDFDQLSQVNAELHEQELQRIPGSAVRSSTAATRHRGHHRQYWKQGRITTH